MGASVGPVMIGVSVSGGIRHRTASETLHTADDVLVGSKVRYLSNFSAAPHSGERQQSALCSRWQQGLLRGRTSPVPREPV